MQQTDLDFPLTAKKIGPGAIPLSRPRVYYCNPSKKKRMAADNRNGNTVLFMHDAGHRKVEVYETPDEVLGMEALSQGATASQVFTKIYGTLTPTASATASDQSVPTKYYNEISTSLAGSNFVRLPDPYVRRLVILQNLTTGTITVNARGTTSPINGSTAGYTLQGLERAHFLAPTAATAGTTVGWKVAQDVGQA